MSGAMALLGFTSRHYACRRQPSDDGYSLMPAAFKMICEVSFFIISKAAFIRAESRLLDFTIRL